jgi:hypothetical protein
MTCAHCGHPVSNEAYRYCVECGEPIEGLGDDAGYGDSGTEDYNAGGEADGSYEEAAPPATGLELASGMLILVLAPIRNVAEQFCAAIGGVLDDPRLRSRLPGESLTLLGLGLVGLALLLSLLPFVQGIGLVGSTVMLLGGALVGVNEWRLVTAPGTQEVRTAAAHSLPPALENLPRETQHPGIARAYAALAFTHALLMMGFGLISVLWLLAAIVLGFDQGRRFFASEEYEGYLDAGTFHPNLDRWAVVGANVCTFALLLPWVRSNVPMSGLSGGEQPLATFTQFSLVLLAAFALRQWGLSTLHPIVPVIMAVWLTLWFFLMMSVYTVGPWIFLVGLLMVDAAIALRFLKPRQDRAGEGTPSEEPAPDVDYQG